MNERVKLGFNNLTSEEEIYAVRKGLKPVAIGKYSYKSITGLFSAIKNYPSGYSNIVISLKKELIEQFMEATGDHVLKGRLLGYSEKAINKFIKIHKKGDI